MSLKNNHDQSIIIIEGTGHVKQSDLRYSAVQTILEQHNAVKILDIGCSNAQFIQRLTRCPKYSLLVGLDVDGELLKNTSVENIVPESFQNSILYDRGQPLIVKLYQGDATQPLQNIKSQKFDAITLIQVIQHLPLEKIQSLNQMLFQYYEIDIVIVTTPNRDFNCYFQMGQRKMRHWDHKFEWTQLQFIQYCQSIKTNFDYDYELFGVGRHVTEALKNGYCSQGAVFRKLKGMQQVQQKCTNQQEIPSKNAKLVEQITYPYWKDQYVKNIRNHLIDYCSFKFNKQLSEVPSPLSQIALNTKIGSIMQKLKLSQQQIMKIALETECLVVDNEGNLFYKYEYMNQQSNNLQQKEEEF